ncbi:hypothetical protein E4T43_00496 [Aureobasidium subglaciale]|nr:hypothetical protein E4T43_00496 [Aureobasidium subglaciale]
MTESAKGRRRSSLSAAFENFRNKCRKTRIDSLLSPPKLDSGTSNDEYESNSPSEWEEGVPLTSESTRDKSPGHNSPGQKDHDTVYKDKSSNHSRCDSKLPDFDFDETGFDTGFETGCNSDATSPDENRRLTAALADFTAEVTEAEDFGRYFSPHKNTAADKKCWEHSEPVSPTESKQSSFYTVSATSRTGLLHSDHSGSTLDFEVGVPLQRTVANKNLQQWKTLPQTEPKTPEQNLARNTYISLDEAVADTHWKKEEPVVQAPEVLQVPRTVDGVRLDARPLIRHTGISAPPHSSLHLHTFASRSHENKSFLDLNPAAAPSSTHLLMPEPATSLQLKASMPRRPQATSWFSSSSDSSLEGIQFGCPSFTDRRRSTIKPHLLPPPLVINRKRHPTTLIKESTYPPRPPRIEVSGVEETEMQIYPHTPPKVVSVKERVHRLSGARSLQHAVDGGLERLDKFRIAMGEAVVASGGVGIGWENRGEDENVGARSASVYYGGGFV